MRKSPLIKNNLKRLKEVYGIKIITTKYIRISNEIINICSIETNPKYANTNNIPLDYPEKEPNQSNLSSITRSNYQINQMRMKSNYNKPLKGLRINNNTENKWTMHDYKNNDSRMTIHYEVKIVISELHSNDFVLFANCTVIDCNNLILTVTKTCCRKKKEKRKPNNKQHETHTDVGNHDPGNSTHKKPSDLKQTEIINRPNNKKSKTISNGKKP